MGGRGPAPKSAETRQRRNKKSGAAELEAPDKPKVPAIPNPDKRAWRRLTRDWWKRVWSSPMAARYIPTDVDGLGRLALLVDDYNRDPAKERSLLPEIRLQEARFGLSPLDRSRLQWEIRKAESAGKKNAPPKRSRKVGDPRKILKAVK